MIGLLRCRGQDRAAIGSIEFVPTSLRRDCQHSGFHTKDIRTAIGNDREPGGAVQDMDEFVAKKFKKKKKKTG